MSDAARNRIRPFAVPCVVFVACTVLLAAIAAAPRMAWLLTVSGCGVLIAGGVWEWWRAVQLTADLRQLRTQLSASEIADVGSLRPTTALGREITRLLQATLKQIRSITSHEEAARHEIEVAQNLRVGFVASMGHDLRGPLASMLGFADLLLMDDDAIALKQRDSVQTIRQRTLDLLTLIDEMLDWAKLESGRLTLVRRPVAMEDVMKEIQKLAQARSAGRGLLLHVDVESALPSVAADMGHLPRAVVAVMGDAIRNASKVPLKLTARNDEQGGLILSLHDPSLLIRDEDRARFFEAFRPSYAPSGKRIAGLGLGAACAKAIFRAHGGEVSFTSTFAGGTWFHMTLPPLRTSQHAAENSQALKHRVHP